MAAAKEAASKGPVDDKQLLGREHDPSALPPPDGQAGSECAERDQRRPRQHHGPAEHEADEPAEPEREPPCQGAREDDRVTPRLPAGLLLVLPHRTIVVKRPRRESGEVRGSEIMKKVKISSEPLCS